MRLEKLLFGMLFFIVIQATAQDDPERECKRMRFLAGEELKIKNYAGAASYYIKGEIICGGYDAANYARMIGTLRNAMSTTKDKVGKTAYADTLEAAYVRAEAAGAYNQKDDLFRAANILNTSTPTRSTADELFRRGIEATGNETNQKYVSYFYYNTYAMFAEAKDDVKKAVLKKRLITEYFELSTLISAANMSAKTQETITSYFNYVVGGCDDILPELKGYMENLPTDPEVKKMAVNNFIELLEKKECTSAPEYIRLIDIYVEIDPNSTDAMLKKAKAQASKGNRSGAIATLRKAKEISTYQAQRQEITYMIAVEQFKLKQYSSAYKTTMTITGEHRGKALIIAGRSVGQNAHNCGASTFERKCNNIYAVRLLQQGVALGASASGSIGTYKSRYPSDSEKFDNGSPSSMALVCYGVTVKL